MVIVTAGGLQEKIDSVRYIVNNSTGRLGFLIAQKLANKGEEVYFLHTENIILPPNVVSVPIKNIKNLEEEMRNLLKKNAKAVIHAMAVSDYFVDGIYENGNIKTIENKIDSSEEVILLALRKNKKILPIIKEINKNVILVGFKLTSNKTEEEQIKIAKLQAHNNNCDYVLVNDTTGIYGSKHKAILICKDTHYYLNTKEEIANKIEEVIR